MTTKYELKKGEVLHKGINQRNSQPRAKCCLRKEKSCPVCEAKHISNKWHGHRTWDPNMEPPRKVRLSDDPRTLGSPTPSEECVSPDAPMCQDWGSGGGGGG